MKTLLWTILTVAAPVISAQTLHDYNLGFETSRCLIGKCDIYTGFLLSESPERGQPVAIEVREKLFTTGSIPDIAQLPYGERMPSARAWRGIEIHRNTPVIVVSSYQDGTSTPQLISTSPHDTQLIRALLSHSSELRRSPDAISTLVASLTGDPNPALAAFLVVHLEKIDTVHHPDLAVTLLSQLLGHESVPAEAWDDIVDHIVLDYDRLTPATRTTLLNRLVEVGGATGRRGLEKVGLVP